MKVSGVRVAALGSTVVIVAGFSQTPAAGGGRGELFRAVAFQQAGNSPR